MIVIIVHSKSILEHGVMYPIDEYDVAPCITITLSSERSITIQVTVSTLSFVRGTSWLQLVLYV
jgi:hypothetical protein